MKLSRQDVADIIRAIDDAQAELTILPDDAERNARLESLKQRFSEKLKQSFALDVIA